MAAKGAGLEQYGWFGCSWGAPKAAEESTQEHCNLVWRVISKNSFLGRWGKQIQRALLHSRFIWSENN